MRADGRQLHETRKINFVVDPLPYAEGSVEVSFGDTRVLCAASVEANVPKWLSGSGQGWVTAEYGMLPRSTHSRITRDKAMNSGRTQEISRLIARSLRASVDLKSLGEKQICIDCDVIQADGGTRTAAISGGFVALALALRFLHAQGQISTLPLKGYVSAVSVGLLNNKAHLDLNYDEDSICETDMNFVMNQKHEFIEIQGTAEAHPFSRTELETMMEMAQLGCQEIFRHQSQAIGTFFPLDMG